jgi:peptide deformylase
MAHNPSRFPSSSASAALSPSGNADRLGQPVVIEGLLARCIQHEVDHLNGRLFVDRLSGTVRKHAMRDLRERYAS